MTTSISLGSAGALRVTIAATLMVAALSMSACTTTQKTVGGAIVGGTGGALIGGAVGNTTGAVIGGVGGAVAGGLVGRNLR